MTRPKYPSDTQDQFMVRLPDGMRDEIAAAAKANGRSMNAEAVARLSGGTETLRDRFAMAALTGIIAHTFDDGSDFLHELGPKAAALQAYRFADEMVVVRETTTPHNRQASEAGPRLLSALKRLSDVYDGIYVEGMSELDMSLCREAWAEAEAAIAKAEGV